MALQDDIARLARIPIFAVLEPEALRLLAFSAETRILRAGDVLFRRGDPSDSGYILRTGSIALDPGGIGGPAAYIAHADDLIGETALITTIERPATAVAREPSTVLKVSRSLFHRVLLEFPASAGRLRLLLAERLSAFTADLDAMRQRTIGD
jgi:CRP-like cAMP-binding protein